MDDVEDIKPDVDVTVKEEEEMQPDPDENLMLDSGGGRVWSVKVPKHLMARWSSISKENVHLASVRIYERDPKTGKQRIVMLVPKHTSRRERENQDGLGASLTSANPS